MEQSEPYYIQHALYVPNDPLIGSWYHLHNIQAYLAWDFIRGDSTSRPILGVVDSGVYWDHPDLLANVWLNSGEDINGDGQYTQADINGIDDDGNSYVDDIVGWDFGNSDNDPYEPYPWHGTHVAGCATMASDNGVGGAAVAWGARIMPVKASRDDPNYVVAGYSGIVYAGENGAGVINLSWGSYYYSSVEQNIINAIYALGVVIVAAAGNDNISQRLYPGAYNNVVAVAATGQDDTKAFFSNYGTWVDISAPGEGIFSTYGQNGFSALDGTSMASPITSGVACLIRAANPSMSNTDVINRLLATADTIDHLNPSYRGMLGSGRVNAATAIGRDIFPLLSVEGVTVSLTEDDGDGRLNPNERFNLTIQLRNEWQPANGVIGTLRSDGQFSVIDSVADFGNIPGDGGEGNNASNPFDVRVNPDATIESHQFTLQLETSTGFRTTGTFTVPITLEQAGFPGNIPGAIEGPVLVADFDSDGGTEIIVAGGDAKYYAFEANGSISPGWPVDIAGETPGGPAAGDLDHDGDLEVVGMSRDAIIYAWNSAGTPVSGFPRNLGGLMFGTPVLGDINGDSTLEIIAGTLTNRSVYVLSQNGQDFGNWPFVGNSSFYGSAAIADIDNDDLNEIIFGDFGSTVHVWNDDKTYVPGFPVTVSGQVRTAPAIADIDGDGNLNIVVGTGTGDLYVFDNDGSLMPGWPQHTGNALYSSPTLADIDLDGRLEILVGCNDWNLYVYNTNGQAQFGFPLYTGGIISASPVVGSIDGDAYPDIAFGTYDGKIYAINFQGHLLTNFPIQAVANGQISGSSAIVDLDHDGDCEIITGVRAAGNNLEVIDYKADLVNPVFPWPMFGKEPGRSSYYGFFLTGIEDTPPMPTVLHLGQNYPNPFNAKTSISFSLPYGADVDISVFDLLGSRVRTLQSGYLTAGEHSVIWDGFSDNGTAVTSGIYFYRLKFGRDFIAKRMMLVK
jgi:hypothetical protein